MGIRRGISVKEFETELYCDEPAVVSDDVHLKLFG
jgi:hypothetical protein